MAYENLDRFLDLCRGRGGVVAEFQNIVGQLSQMNPNKTVIQTAIAALSSEVKRKYEYPLAFLDRDFLRKGTVQVGVHPAPAPDRFAQDLAKRVEQRESKVNVQRTANLVYTMSGPTNGTFSLPLRYNMRKTGLGVQDAEILVTLPILVHQGAAAKQHWISLGYAADKFEKTVHGGLAGQGVPGVTGAAAGDAVLEKWTKSINDWWGNAAVIQQPTSGPTSGPQRYYRLKFQFSFTDDPAKACKEVCCTQTTGQAFGINPTGTIDAVRWGVADEGPGGPICHEVGHFLGCPDEYYTITYEGITRAWGQPNQPNAGVMNNPATKPFARHYRKMGQELAKQFGFSPDNASIILDVTLLLNNPQQRRHKLSGHIWD